MVGRPEDTRLTKHQTSDGVTTHTSNYSGFSKETPELKFRLRFFFRSVANRSQVIITHAQPSDSDTCAKFWAMSTWHGVVADHKKLSRRKISTYIVYNTLKTHTKYAHRRNLSSRNMPYQLSYLMLVERSIYANLIVYVDVIVNQAEYQYEVWKVKGTRAARLENLSMHVFSHVSPCHLHCTVMLMLKNLLNKRTFKFNCRERIRQSIRR